MMDDDLKRVRLDVAEKMDGILANFKPEAKITVYVRQPDAPDGSQDFIMSNDDPIEASAGIIRLISRDDTTDLTMNRS